MNVIDILAWGFAASLIMSTFLEASRLLGWSRISLPYLFGTVFTLHRGHATTIGYTIYFIGGWVFACIYAALVQSVSGGVFTGAVIGLLHGVALLSVFLPFLSLAHPNLASDYDGAHALPMLEPLGPFATHYGVATPVVTLVGQTVYGAVLGFGFGG